MEARRFNPLTRQLIDTSTLIVKYPRNVNPILIFFCSTLVKIKTFRSICLNNYFPFWMFSAKQGHYWYHFYKWYDVVLDWGLNPGPPTLEADFFILSNSLKYTMKIIPTIPMCLSTLKILLLAPVSYNLDVTNFSTPNTIPSLPLIPIAVLKFRQKCHYCYPIRNRKLVK